MRKEFISKAKAACLVVVAATICSVVTCIATAILVGDKRYEAGIEAGKGTVLDAAVGEAYELRLYGYKDGKVYEMEGPYGYTINGQPVISRLPTDARHGDFAMCVKPGEGIKVFRNM